MKDFLFSYLQNEYKRYSGLIMNFIFHIERLFSNNIINNDEKIKNINTLNDTIKELNDTYNIKLRKIQKDDKEIDKKIKLLIDSFLINEKNIDNVYSNLIDTLNINKLYNIDTYKEYYITDFNLIRKKLLKIGSMYGFYKLYDAFNLIYGEQFNLVFKNHDIIDILNNYYIPTSYNIITDNAIDKIEIISKIKNSDNNYILDNYAEVLIKENIKKKIYIFEGYFINENTNCILRTSQICNSFLFKKKKDLEMCINSNMYINDKFKNIFIKNINIGEIISYNKDSIIEKINSDYDKYLKYSRTSFKKLMEEITNNNIVIHKIYEIIKLLLFGSNDNINIAGLLFSLLKDKKNGSMFISDIIYKNLNYYFQSKLKKSSINIKYELDKLKNLIFSDIDLKKQIALCNDMPPNAKKLSFEKIEEMKTSTNEYSKQSTFVNILLNFPWKTNDDIFTNLHKDNNKSKEFLINSKNILDQLVYGHSDCKSTINELIGKWISNPSSMGKSIGLYGPAGVGKTLIAKGLGKALNIPFVQINLGGLEDSCVLNGHSYTYSSAQPGLIIKKMVEAGQSRCVMFFDELDKACTKHGINEIFNVLIHATDTNTNDAFNDKFFQEITFPINNVLFIFSYNDPSKVDKILLDRMEKIEVQPYSVSDKLIITKNFLLKEISKDINIDSENIKINDNDIEYIIDSFTFEAGVRELKRKFETLFLKLNLDKIYKRNIFENIDNISRENPIILTRQIINEYINKQHFNIKQIHMEPNIGIINGLFATTSGYGGIIPILIYNNYIGTKFELKLTGSQGDVMKESVSFAFTIAMNLIKKNYRDKFIKNSKYGLHIHTPDGATPKDGPSAGSAFTTAFISIILNKKIRNDIAMTGEIEMNGNITEIGGLHYKLVGAKKAGVRFVFVPKNNEKDINKIKENDKKLFDESFDIKLVSHIKEILNDALIDNNQSFDSSIYLE